MSVEQLPLFAVNKELPLSAAISGFHQHMINKGFTDNTISAFLNDLRIFTRYWDDDPALSQIGTNKLQDFMTYLRLDRGVPCSPKSYARRMTGGPGVIRPLCRPGLTNQTCWSCRQGRS